jgi:hypothetical protein
VNAVGVDEDVRAMRGTISPNSRSSKGPADPSAEVDGRPVIVFSLTILNQTGAVWRVIPQIGSSAFRGRCPEDLSSGKASAFI